MAVDVQRASLLGGQQRKALKGLGQFVNQGIGQGAEVFGGQRVAGLSGLEQQLGNTFGGLAPQIGDAFSGSLQGFNQASQGLQGFLGDFNEGNFQSSVVDPSVRNFQQNVIPGITERFSNVAGSSGVLQNAVAQAGGDLASNLAFQRGQARNQFDANKLNASGQLANQSQGLGNLGLNFANAVGSFGGLQRNIEQAGLGAQQDIFNEGQAVNNPILNLLPLLLGTRGFENIATQSDDSGLLGSLGSLGGSFLGTEAGAGGLANFIPGFG